MGIYVARRLLWIPFLLLAVTSVTFTLGQYGPGDPVEVLLGQHYNPDVVERIRHNHRRHLVALDVLFNKGIPFAAEP